MTKYRSLQEAKATIEKLLRDTSAAEMHRRRFRFGRRSPHRGDLHRHFDGVGSHALAVYFDLAPAVFDRQRHAEDFVTPRALN